MSSDESDTEITGDEIIHHSSPSTSTAIQTPLPQFEDARPGETHEKMSTDLPDNDSFILIESNENLEVNENSSLLQSTEHNDVDVTRFGSKTIHPRQIIPATNQTIDY
ncbi:hypothetical protein KQX54_007499 [Cotesia glomerata]|uniref:Uncharacterized protein n=1 Tax=Cotesia glomerata TaxID=32391 RepID=A0AAV7I221_COTGL|nr:hypothetical protein KQX54_007499 [Cotesia glomerata]